MEPYDAGSPDRDMPLAVGEVALACDATGSLIAISALPGQGG